MEGMEKGGGGEEPPPVRPHDHLSIAEESRPPVHWEPILNNSQSIGFQDLLGNNPITENWECTSSAAMRHFSIFESNAFPPKNLIVGRIIERHPKKIQNGPFAGFSGA